MYNITYKYGRDFSLQSPFGNFGEFLNSSYPDAADAGSLPEELDPFPELQLGNPQGVPPVDDSVQSQSIHQQPSQQPPPPPPLSEDIQTDSLRYANYSFKLLIYSDIDN